MEQLIHTFYDAFNTCNAQAMNACYHTNVRFTDPAFGLLDADRTRAMWQMLCANQRGKSFKVVVGDIEIAGDSATAHWQAWYEFSKTGRPVHNSINASFRFQDGLIIEHIDEFDLHRWAKQALGLSGWLLGGTSFFKNRLHKQTAGMLDRYMQKNTSP